MVQDKRPDFKIVNVPSGTLPLEQNFEEQNLRRLRESQTNLIINRMNNWRGNDNGAVLIPLSPRPVIGQVLTVTSANAVSWQTLSLLTGLDTIYVRGEHIVEETQVMTPIDEEGNPIDVERLLSTWANLSNSISETVQHGGRHNEAFAGYIREDNFLDILD